MAARTMDAELDGVHSVVFKVLPSSRAFLSLLGGSPSYDTHLLVSLLFH